jgi:acyl-CoA reductase-like NAD-dependent aldehyde dehydrogenase
MTMYYYAVAKRQFLHPEFSAWLYQLVDALFRRRDEDIRAVSKEIGATYLKETEIYEFDTGVDAFLWTQPKKA